MRKSLRKVKKNLSKSFKKKQTPATEGDTNGQDDENVNVELAAADSAIEEAGDANVEEDIVEEAGNVIGSVSYEGLPAYNSTRGKYL